MNAKPPSLYRTKLKIKMYLKRNEDQRGLPSIREWDYIINHLFGRDPVQLPQIQYYGNNNVKTLTSPLSIPPLTQATGLQGLKV